MTVWLPLTDIAADMGYLKVVPGSRRDIRRIEIGQADFRPGMGGGGASMRIAGLDIDALERDGIEVPMRAGDAMVFSCMTLHRSGANRSAEGRARRVMNPRYGRMDDPAMVARGWKCVSRDDVFVFPQIHPDLVDQV